MPVPATKKQINYLEILFNELGFDLANVKGFLDLRFAKSALDELYIFEASAAINELLVMKLGGMGAIEK